MSWRDELLPASFRGASFYVTSSTASLGRRTITREYPLRDTPVTEDLGRRKRSWRLELFVLGPNYTGARDALIKALETSGPGQLILPLQGAVSVVLEGEVTLTESSAQGGMATFSATFVEAGELPTLKVVVDTQAKVTAAAEALIAAAAQQFEGQYDSSGQASYIDEAEKAAVELLAPLSQALHQVVSPTLSVPGAALVTWVANTLTTLVSTLSELQAFEVLLAQASTSSRLETPTTPRRSQQVNNAQQLTLLVQRSALSQACQLASNLTWQDRSSALQARSQLLEAFDMAAGVVDMVTGDSLDSDMLQALQALRVATAVDLEQRAMALPRVVNVQLSSALPALVVAYHLFNDLSREDEILSRNGLTHPAFVPGGIDLEVLSE